MAVRTKILNEPTFGERERGSIESIGQATARPGVTTTPRTPTPEGLVPNPNPTVPNPYMPRTRPDVEPSPNLTDPNAMPTLQLQSGYKWAWSPENGSWFATTENYTPAPATSPTATNYGFTSRSSRDDDDGDMADLLAQLFGANGFNMGGSIFSDPAASPLLNFAQQRVGQLTAPVYDPSMEAFVQAAQQIAQQLQTPYVNPQTAPTVQLLQQILKDVSGEPFTDSESAALRAEAFDQLEQDRTTALDRELARMAFLGHGKGSGTIVEGQNRINRGYDANRAAQQRALTIAGIDQRNQNRTTAAEVGQLLREITGQEAAMNEARGSQAVSALQAVSGARASQRAEQEARLDKALSLLSLPVQLSDQRLQTALQVLGMAGGSSNPTSIFSALSNLANQTQANNLAQQQSNAGFWASLGQMIGNFNWGAA